MVKEKLMVSESNFIVRISGKRANSYYIDYSGVYKVNEIAKIAGLEPSKVKELYQNGGAVYDETQEVHYFGSIEAAKAVIAGILGNVRSELKGKLLYLTEAEVEYIRKALINEGSNPIHLKNKIKDAIFKKLNS